MSLDNVDRVKTDLKNLLETLTTRSTFYTLIEKCVNQFWNNYTESHPGMGGWETNVVWRPITMSPGEARTIIVTNVIPWLRYAKNCVAENSRYYGDFVALFDYVETHFAPPASVQPAPPASNPSPPGTERATTHAVASLQYQFKALQEQINVLELTKREFNSFKMSDYKVDIPYFHKEITDLKKAQSRDKASFDSQIAKLQREVDSFPGILARVQTLESSLATLQRTPAQPPPKPRPWPFGTEQATLLDSRPDRQSQARVSALLHEMHEMRDLHEFNRA